jgi:apolipoprotein N-acyltransferase
MLSKIIMLVISSLLFAIPMTSNLYGITTIVAPALLLIYFYRATTKREILLAFLGIMIATIFSTYRVMPGGVISAIISAVIMSAVILLLLILNKWIVNHTGAVIAVLFYPILMTGYEYFMSYGSQYSTFNSSVYSLIGLKPLIQWTSVGGIWLVIFLINLIIALIAFGFRNQLQVKYIITACLIGVVLFIGGTFIMKESKSESIQATGLTPNQHLWDVAAGSLFGKVDEKPTYDEASWNMITEDLLQKTGEATRNGSQLVVWAEGATALNEEKEIDLLTAVKAMAQDNNSVLSCHTFLFMIKPVIFMKNGWTISLLL